MTTTTHKQFYSVTLIWSDDSFRSFKVYSISPKDALYEAMMEAVDSPDGELAATGLSAWLVLDTLSMEVTKGDYMTAPIDEVCDAYSWK